MTKPVRRHRDEQFRGAQTPQMDAYRATLRYRPMPKSCRIVTPLFLNNRTMGKRFGALYGCEIGGVAVSGVLDGASLGGSVAGINLLSCSAKFKTLTRCSPRLTATLRSVALI